MVVVVIKQWCIRYIRYHAWIDFFNNVLNSFLPTEGGEEIMSNHNGSMDLKWFH